MRSLGASVTEYLASGYSAVLPGHSKGRGAPMQGHAIADQLAEPGRSARHHTPTFYSIYKETQNIFQMLIYNACFIGVA